MKILFVCTGNICRSPTAHAVFRHMAAAKGVDAVVDSAGTYSGHIGQPSDRRASMTAKKRGYDMADLRARAVTYGDFENFDLVLCMDAGHKLELERVAPKHLHHKIQMFDDRDVGDPYYGPGDGFERVLDQIEAACARWIEKMS